MSLPRKIVASLATVAAWVGLMLFATVGAFDAGDDRFPSSVLAPAQ